MLLRNARSSVAQEQEFVHDTLTESIFNNASHVNSVAHFSYYLNVGLVLPHQHSIMSFDLLVKKKVKQKYIKVGCFVVAGPASSCAIEVGSFKANV